MYVNLRNISVTVLLASLSMLFLYKILVYLSVETPIYNITERDFALKTWRSVTGRLKWKTYESLSGNTTNGPGDSNVSIHPLYPHLLLYNRVSKCASSTLIGILSGLSKINGFRHITYKNYDGKIMTQTEQEEMENLWYKASKTVRLSFDRHFYYFDPKSFKKDEVAWINMVRDPVERYISQFYFLRSVARYSYKAYNQMFLKLQLDECTPKGNPDCSPRPGDITMQQLTFFCGNHPLCKVVGSRWALQMAKANVEHYSVIGLKEDVPTSLRVLEHVLPEFFNNYPNVSYGSGKVKVNERPEEYKPFVSNTTKVILRNNMKEDVEFYEFVRQRFYKQVEDIERLKK